MNRRTFLQASIGGLSFAAGCSSPLGQSSPTLSPAVESRVEIPPCPAKPDPLTTQNVGPYAVQFEKAYFVRNILREHERVTYVEFLTIDESPEVTREKGGFKVQFDARPAYGYRPNPGTPETAHADYARYTLHYFISNETVRRTKTTSQGTAAPFENGTVVHCPPR